MRYSLFQAHKSGSNAHSAHSSVAAGKRPGFTLAKTGKVELQPRRRGGFSNPPCGMALLVLRAGGLGAEIRVCDGICELCVLALLAASDQRKN